MTPDQIAINTLYIGLAAAGATIFSCFATIALTVLTRSYVNLTRELLLEAKATREEEARPKIMVSIISRDDEPNWIDLIVKNIGRGYAHNIRFNLKPDFSLGVTSQNGVVLKLSDVGFIANGIPSFAPEQKLQFFLTNLIGTLEEKAREPIGITVTYTDGVNKDYENHYFLDFGLFRNMATVGKPPMETIADSVEKMQKDISNLATGRSALSVRFKDHEKRLNQQIPTIILPSGVTNDDGNSGSFV